MNVNHNMIDMHYVTIDFMGKRDDASMTVRLWTVRGNPWLYPTKMAAEVQARNQFPNDSMEMNYGRIGHIKFMKLKQED